MKFRDLLNSMSTTMHEVQLIRVNVEAYGMQFFAEGYYSKWKDNEVLLNKTVTDIYAKEGTLIIKLR